MTTSAIAQSDVQGLRLLIVEDEVLVGMALERALKMADILSERSFLYLFATGYGIEGLRESDKDKPVLQKSYNFADLIRIVARWRPLGV
ncbi:hypothetical protein [Azospirillum sp. BE72]|uniref:hypothetical protein n=1 Tax=Azospirillum sp. BE72 TaxID=2817776 RepID=UPI00285E5B82|nr:hypothetical protein [Azospirillum sp. BE72]MDR6775332.1 hypothetical protein [Azospirillum sp. BE72]